MTNHEELVFSAFGVNVHGFVRKQYLTMQLGNMLTSAIEILNMFVILEDNLDSREIKYMKSLRVYTELFLANGEKKVTRISINYYLTYMNGDIILNGCREDGSIIDGIECE